MRKTTRFVRITAVAAAMAVIMQTGSMITKKSDKDLGVMVAQAETISDGTTTEVLATTESVATTTEIPATTESAATTQAVVEELNKDSGFGFAIMNGESMTLDMGGATVAYIPIKVESKGYLTILRNDVSSENFTISVVETDRTTEILKAEKVGSEDNTGAFAISAGNYYIKVEGNAGSSCELSAKMTTGVEMTAGKKRSIVLGKHSAGTKYYMELTAKSTGLMTVENMGSAAVKVTLCNSSKKALSTSNSLAKYSSKNHKDQKNSAGFGVKKGNRYLICVTAKASVKKVTLKYSIKKHASVGGSNFTKATTIKKGKTVGATLAAGQKSSYFKFSKTSYSRKSVTLKTFRNQGKIKVSLYYKEVKGKKKGKILPVKVNGKQVSWSQKAEYQSTLKIPANWPKVTYYLKVSAASSKASGSYYLTVK